MQTVTECIHGFEAGMCDICFPRVAPEPARVAASAPSRTRATAPRADPTRPRRASPAATAPGTSTLPPFASRRLYHVTHARNLEAILLDDAVVAVASGAEPDMDVAAPLVRQLRATTDVGDGRRVAEFVPFMLTPDATRWVELRDGAEGAHWSAAARLSAPTEYVMLVVGADRIGDDVVVAAGDASAPATRFTIGEPGGGVARLTREDPELVRAELLVAGRVPLDALVLLGVPNEPMRSRVRAMFDAVEKRPPRIVVHPPWFTPAEE